MDVDAPTTTSPTMEHDNGAKEPSSTSTKVEQVPQGSQQAVLQITSLADQSGPNEQQQQTMLPLSSSAAVEGGLVQQECGGQTSISLLQRLQPQPNNGEPSMPSLLWRISCHPHTNVDTSTSGLLQRLSLTPAIANRKWAQRPGAAVVLGHFYVFSMDYVKSRRRSEGWIVVIKPIFVWALEGMTALAIVFRTPVDASRFCQLWNQYASDVTEAADVRANVDSALPPPRDVVSPSPTGGASNMDNKSDFFYCSSVSWNVAEKYELILDDMSDMLMGMDIIMMQETHHYDGEHIKVLDGYRVFSRARETADFDYPWGGVVTLVKSFLNPVFHDEFSGPDLLVVEVGGFLYFNCYILPQNSRQDWST
ncbi:hypothetical protein V5O48_017589 [Marasmius crinis-equi]|uniref:Endonuclease/exonuclease/phosphatase domain-containing protein n=1 Tax=Marasmius crinis-equi TaxID=585013 RepID=A0ABR3ENL6_9AGAR